MERRPYGEDEIRKTEEEIENPGCSCRPGGRYQPGNQKEGLLHDRRKMVFPDG